MVRGIAFSPDNFGDIFASASSDGILRIFDIRCNINGISYSQFNFVFLNHFVSWFQVPVIETRKPPSCSVLTSVKFSPKDSTQLATAAGKNGIQVIDFRANPNKYTIQLNCLFFQVVKLL